MQNIKLDFKDVGAFASGSADWLKRQNETLTARIASLINENNALRARAAALSRLRVAGGEIDDTSVWRAMIASPQCKYVAWPHVVANSGVAGVILYGPYQHFSVGDYDLTLRMKAQPRRGVDTDVVGVFEVVYGDVFIMRRVLRAQSGSEYALSFCISEEAANLFTGEHYEFRLIGFGDYEFEISDLVLTQQESGEAAIVNELALLDWVRLGSGAMPRKALFDPIVSPRTQTGHICFGPYCRILPGPYRLEGKLLVDLPQGGNPALAVVDVLSDGQTVLARKEFSLAPGRQEIAMEFEIPQAVSAEQIISAIEFRIDLPQAGVELQILDLNCCSSKA